MSRMVNAKAATAGLCTAVLLGGGMIAGVGQSARADNYSGATGRTGCYGVNEADGFYHTFYWDDLRDVTQVPANNSRLDDFEPTALDTVVLGSAGQQVDVAAHDNFYTDYCGYPWGSIAGLVTCAELSSGGQDCAKHHAYFDLNDFTNAGLAIRNSITCHEFGHTVGLKHRDAGCMTDDPDNFPPDLTDHDRDHIQANY